MIPSQNEYEKFRSPPELLLFWKQCQDSLTDEEWWLRKSTIAKRVVEELGPIAFFAMKYYRPGLEVWARGLVGNQPFDGEIQVSGWQRKSFKLEVANTNEYNDALRREMLHHEGGAPGWGLVRREKGKVIAEYGAHSYGDDLERLGNLCAERFRVKQNEHAYEKGTILIIQVEFHRSITHSEFRYFNSPLRGVITHEGCQFAEVHIFNSCDNELRKVSASSSSKDA
jgi:hypothetical protein